MVSQDGEKSKLPGFSSILKMNAENLKTGRFYLSEYGCISTLVLDEIWKKNDSIHGIAGKPNVPADLFTKELNPVKDVFLSKQLKKRAA